jgi:hypothetical protein
MSVIPLGDSNSSQSYQDMSKTNARFFGGGSLANPESASSIVKKAKEFESGNAGFKVLRKTKKKSKKK